MATFRVEFISQAKVERALIIAASTPLEAAQLASNGTVTFRRDQDDWIKVTPTKKSTAYEFVRSRNKNSQVAS